MYHYETLSDDQFQKFCQTLVVDTFPDAQCLPVNQPDGGRDAILNGMENTETIVFQVKYSQNPFSKDDRDAIEKLIITEKEKVLALIKKGAKKYIFITNVRGSSHPDAGSVDKVNSTLTAAFGIPSYCWWRDDIDAHLNRLDNIKWSFPTILKATDLIPLLLKSHQSEASRIRNDAIKTYIATQHQSDEEVKFKQVEIQNKLLDLFVDVPISRSASYAHSQYINNDESYEVVEDHETGQYGRIRRLVGASQVLLNDDKNERAYRIVLEGAPGQGKSTITQYICQTYRMRFLNIITELDQIPLSHKSGILRIPMRVDLRDFATWLKGKNPFSSNNAENLPTGSTNSLESFLAFQISFISGGFNFTVADLAAISKESHILLVLDGFDEVAEISTRKTVVEEISKSSKRFEAISRSTKIIVTSRPSAFANSAGFPEKEWRHLELKSLSRVQIEQYANKWMRARRLSEKEGKEIFQILSNKMDQPHMRDLARNPMQLAILLTLISTKGGSLPDKRTALYDDYMDLFFSRESEKSKTVLDHRLLLIDIHQYLAWKLHLEAEDGKTRGSITIDDLKILLNKYLTKQGHDTTLVEELFQGMVERVVALVSRIEGTFEFEVQPLREYFAGKYLYETAPYSPPGKEKKGTKPDRFEAISKNFYWLNVTRFYCGCYSSGELSSLIDGVQDLAKNKLFKFTSHPKALALMLLTDWVFSQQPLAVKRVIEGITNSQLRIFLSMLIRNHDYSFASLPDKCGRDYLVNTLQEKYLVTQQRDTQENISKIIYTNTTFEQRLDFWISLREKYDESIWLQFALDLKIFGRIGSAEFNKLKINNPKLIPCLLEAGRFDLIEKNKTLIDESFNYALEDYPSFYALHDTQGKRTYISILHAILSPYQYALTLQKHSPNSPMEFTRKNGNISIEDLDLIINGNDPSHSRYLQFFQAYRKVAALSSTTWRSHLEPWDKLVEAGRATFGDQFIFKILAIYSSAIKSKSDLGISVENIFNTDISLCERVRYARLRSGNAKWWEDQINNTKNEEDKIFLALILLSSATERTLEILAPKLSKLIDRLDSQSWEKLYKNYQAIMRFGDDNFTRLNIESFSSDLSIFSIRLLAIIELRGTPPLSSKITKEFLFKYTGKDRTLLHALNAAGLRTAPRTQAEWASYLPVVRKTYRTDPIAAETLYAQSGFIEKMPINIATEICNDEEKYPLWILNYAEQCLTKFAKKSSEKISKASKEWTD